MHFNLLDIQWTTFSLSDKLFIYCSFENIPPYHNSIRDFFFLLSCQYDISDVRHIPLQQLFYKIGFYKQSIQPQVIIKQRWCLHGLFLWTTPRECYKDGPYQELQGCTVSKVHTLPQWLSSHIVPVQTLICMPFGVYFKMKYLAFEKTSFNF